MSEEATNQDLQIRRQVETCGFDPLRRMGKGSYGLVYEMGDANGDLFAFKYMTSRMSYERYGLEGLNEIDILSRVNHPYVIHVATIITPHNCDIDGLAIVLPLAERTLHALHRDNRATSDIKLPIFFKLATALDFLHSHNILHLDIKAQNVVLQDLNNNHPFFIDFGLSMVVDDTSKGRDDYRLRVTMDHRPPELLVDPKAPDLLGAPYLYNAAVDVWSFGIMMLYMMGGTDIYNVDFKTITPETFKHVVIRTFNNPLVITALLESVRIEYRDDCIDLLSRILRIDPKERLTTHQISQHPLFDKFRKPVVGSLIEPHVGYDYAPDHRDILKLLINWGHKIYSNSRIELLFLAVDLYNRASSYYKERTPLARMSLAATTLWMAGKLLDNKDPLDTFYLPFINEMVPSITAKDILSAEVEIVHLLGGVLNISRLYRECKTANDLIYSFQHVVLASDPTTYARVDIPAWLAVVQTLPKISHRLDKDMDISELFV